MSNPLNEQVEKQNTPWTILSDQEGVVKNVLQKKTQQVAPQDWKKLKVLPYLFAASIFWIIFLFSSQFQNLGADLFNSSGSEDVRFGMPVTDNPLLENVSATGALTQKDTKKNQTGSLLETAEVEKDLTQPATSNVQESDVVTTPQTVQINSLENTQTSSTNTNIIPENLHTSATSQVVPVTTNTTNDSSDFRVNTHTYDKVDQVQITDNVEPLQLENLHTAASFSQTHTISKPEQNVQSGPEENLLIWISMLLSSFACFGMKRVRTRS